MKTLKDLPTRLEAVRKIVEAGGGKQVASYATLGNYDVISIIEAPSDEEALKIAVKIAAQGNLTAETLKAWPMSQFSKLVRK